MARLGLALIIPARVGHLIESWKLVEKHRVYVADALQIASARYVKVESFISEDRRLHEVALSEGLNIVYVGAE